jgi:hypothetical protein
LFKKLLADNLHSYFCFTILYIIKNVHVNYMRFIIIIIH